MTPHNAQSSVIELILPSCPATAADVFELIHLLIEANHELTGHELWLLAHEIVYPRRYVAVV